jgi:hypothetical protein
LAKLDINNQNHKVYPNQSRMAQANDDLVISVSEADEFILQLTASAGTMNTLVNKGPKSYVTDPGLVSVKTIRDLNVKIEELQQESLRVKNQISSRDSCMERGFLAQKREINTLKRNGCQGPVLQSL